MITKDTLQPGTNNETRKWVYEPLCDALRVPKELQKKYQELFQQARSSKSPHTYICALIGGDNIPQDFRLITTDKGQGEVFDNEGTLIEG